jgi:hypothetical protein
VGETIIQLAQIKVRKLQPVAILRILQPVSWNVSRIEYLRPDWI